MFVKCDLGVFHLTVSRDPSRESVGFNVSQRLLYLGLNR
jgi:hypothetical protein